MSVPTYFVCDTQTALRDVLNESQQDPVAHAQQWWTDKGLWPVVRNSEGRIAAGFVQSGPGGQSGIWVTAWPAHANAPKPLGIHVSKQHWQQVRRDIWVGWTTDQPPTPDDLSNGNLYDLSGTDLKLCDGKSWTIPEIREPVRGGYLLPTDAQFPQLPTLVKRDLDGNLCRPVKPQFESLWDTSGRWFDIWCEIHFTGRQTFNSEDALQFCVELLGLRYRFCDYTNDALGLLDSSNFQQIVEIAIGWQPVRQLLEASLGLDDAPQKKSSDSATADSVSGNSGQRDSGRTTAPPAANSGSQSTPTEQGA